MAETSDELKKVYQALHDLNHQEMLGSGPDNERRLRELKSDFRRKLTVKVDKIERTQEDLITVLDRVIDRIYRIMDRVQGPIPPDDIPPEYGSIREQLEELRKKVTGP